MGQLVLNMRFLWLMVAVLATTAGLPAQNADGPVKGASEQPRPTFEVASVKPNKSSVTAMTIQWTPNGRFRATNVPLQTLISVAFSLRSRDQIVNAPSWTAVERFDIEGRPFADVPRAQHVFMLQALLADRFALVVRPVASELPVYVLARRTGNEAALPRGLRESTRRCEATAGLAATDDSKQAASSRSDCFLRGDSRGGRIIAVGARMPAFVFQLSSMLGVKVIDQTGLQGRYDFEVVSPDAANAQPEDLMARQAWLIAAVEGQLGLDLRRDTASAAAVYVERVDRPTPN
jgi:uncharacterized protein (TIGR03435 family)